MRELILEGRILRKRLVKKAILMSLDAGLIILSFFMIDRVIKIGEV